MIHITEDLLYEVLHREIIFLKNNPDEILNNFYIGSKSNREKLVKYLTNKENQLFLEHNYPRDPARVPTISIILGGETSTPEGLGSLLLEETQQEYIDKVEDLTPIYDLNNHLILQTSNYPISDVSVSNGTHIITSFDISKYNSGKISSPSINFREGNSYRVQYKYLKEIRSNTGMQYDVQYRIEIYTQNADLTTLLYSLVKYILLKNIVTLEDVGYRLINISGTDFEPMPDYFPGIFLYRRTVIFNAKIVDSIQSSDQIIRAIESNIKLYEYMAKLDDRYPSIIASKLEESNKFNMLIELLEKKNVLSKSEMEKLKM